MSNEVEINACPSCKLRGSTLDWQRFGGCPHGCGYIGEPVDYDLIKGDCTCKKVDVTTMTDKKTELKTILLDENCPQHGYTEWGSGTS